MMRSPKGRSAPLNATTQCLSSLILLLSSLSSRVVRSFVLLVLSSFVVGMTVRLMGPNVSTTEKKTDV